MSHHSSPPPKHKGEHKGHGLPRGSERWAGLGVEVFEAWVTIGLIWVGEGDMVFICVTPSAHIRGSSSRDKDRSATVSSSVPMPVGGKASRTNCPPPVPQKTTNRLINEKSPYLLQHAYNPVDW